MFETESGTFLYYSSPGADGGDQDIYASRQRADGSFGPGNLVPELSTAANDQMPNVSRDGLEIVFASDRAGGAGAMDVYRATRDSTADAWSAPVNVGPAARDGNGRRGGCRERRPGTRGERAYNRPRFPEVPRGPRPRLPACFQPRSP